MSRPLRDTDNHLNFSHRSADGSEMNAGDIPLPDAAVPLTGATTIEAWLESIQRQLNAMVLAGLTPPSVPQLAGILQEQPQQRHAPTWFQPDTEVIGSPALPSAPPSAPALPLQEEPQTWPRAPLWFQPDTEANKL